MRLITPPSVEPVTVSQLAWQLRLTTEPDADYTGVDESFLQALIKAARDDAENYTERHWATKTVAIAFDSFDDVMILPRDVLSVDAINYIDTDNVAQQLTLISSDYTTVGTTAGRCELVLLNSYLKQSPLPDLADRPNAIEVLCTLGQPEVEGSAFIPETVRHAILMIASHWYENRESVAVTGAGVELKPVAQSYSWLLDSHKFFGVG